MKSIQHKGYFGENGDKSDWLILRTWDGYDKPNYYRLIELQPDEINLNAGRLKNFIHFREPEWCYGPTTVEVMMVQTPGYRVKESYTQVIEWCAANSTGKWSFIPMYDGEAQFWFENISDAVHFKLVYA